MGREDIDRSEYFEQANERQLNPNSVVCDSSSLISLTDTGLLGALMMLRKEIQAELVGI